MRWLFVFANLSLSVSLRFSVPPVDPVSSVASASSASASSASVASATRVEATRMSMGCLYSISAYAERPEAVRGALQRALDEVDRIDRLMSHYREDSPLSRINRRAAREPVSVDRELFDFIALALGFSAASDGAFDVTVGPLMKAWGFFRGDGRLPGDVTGFRHVRLNYRDRTIRFDRDGVEFDLGGIAKGYAVDRAVGVLTREGVTAALVNACGSTIYAIGAPPGRPHWTVDIQDPLDADKVAFTVALADRALSVSGVSEKFFEADGVRYSHIMDPRTGWPARGVLAVVVRAPDGTTGDAIDNVLFVQGVGRSPAFLRMRRGVDATVLLPDGPGRWRRVEIP
jgi:FAD:protein FMN transferase